MSTSKREKLYHSRVMLLEKYDRGGDLGDLAEYANVGKRALKASFDKIKRWTEAHCNIEWDEIPKGARRDIAHAAISNKMRKDD